MPREPDSESSKLRDTLPNGMGAQTARAAREGSEVGRRCPMQLGPRSVDRSDLSGRGERTGRNVISVRIPERELLAVSVRIHVWLLFEPSGV